MNICWFNIINYSWCTYVAFLLVQMKSLEVPITNDCKMRFKPLNCNALRRNFLFALFGIVCVYLYTAHSSLCVFAFFLHFLTLSREIIYQPLFPSCILFVSFILRLSLCLCACMCVCVCYSYMFSSDTIHLQRPSIIHSTMATLLTLFHTNKYCTCAKYWISRQQSVFIRILLLMMVCWSETPAPNESG